MNFLNLKYFLVLAEELNFTQSAERLHISQQSLSSHVSRLEKECGLQLISREPPLHLTEAGMEFARSARVMLKEKETLEKRPSTGDHHHRHTLLPQRDSYAPGAHPFLSGFSRHKNQAD